MTVDYVSLITEQVSDRFDASEAYAGNSWDLFIDFLSELGNGVDYTPSFIDLDYSLVSPDLGQYAPERPDDLTVSVDLPSSPEMGSLTTVSISPTDVPSFDFTAPSIYIPEPPSVTWPDDPGDIPNLSDIETPTKPAYSLPDAPTVTEISVPGAPEISIPDLDANAPTLTLDAPISFAHVPETYQSDIADQLETIILDYLQNGGTGLGADVEDALWARARARQETTKETAYNQVISGWSERGFTLPPGPMVGQVQELVNEQTRADQQINYEIAIEQARLAFENTKFVQGLAVTHENNLRTYSNQVAQRAFEIARYAKDAAIAIYQAQVGRYQADIAKYQATAQVFDARLRKAATEIERFKGELEAARVSAAVQQQYVDIYTAQVEAVGAVQRLYATEMEAARLRAQIDEVRIAGFRAKVEAFVARMNANTARYGAYEAQIRGEGAKAQVWRDEVGAYLGEVEAAKAKSSINIAEAEAEVALNNQKIEKYRAEVQGYIARVQAAMAELDAEVRVYGSQTDQYRADTQLAASKIDSDIRVYQAQAAHEDNRVRLNLEQAKINLDSAQRAHELQVELVKAGTNVTAQMVASSLSAVSAGAHLGFQGGFNQSYSTDQTKDVPTHSYIYNSSLSD